MFYTSIYVVLATICVFFVTIYVIGASIYVIFVNIYVFFASIYLLFATICVIFANYFRFLANFEQIPNRLCLKTLKSALVFGQVQAVFVNFHRALHKN